MRLCLPIDVRREGGMYTFVGNFIAWLERTGRSFTQDLGGEYDVLFVNSWIVPPRIVRRLKRERAALRIAHRVDGAALDYGGNPASDGVQARVNVLADVSIFQSAYSRFSTREKFRVIVNDGPVIHNPVDVSLFTPEAPTRDRPSSAPRVACATWSVNPLKGTAGVDALASRHPDVTFVLCGRFDAVRSRSNVVRMGHLSREQMAEALRSCDVFLSLSENDSCPNVVIEALASGLPVLYVDSGGVPELVGECGAAIDTGNFRAALDAVLANRPRLARCARERALTRFSPDVIFPQYLHAMMSATRKPLPTAVQIVKLAGAGYPVLPHPRTPRQLAGALARRVPGLVRRLRGRASPFQRRVGWVTYDSFPRRKRRFAQLDSFTGMRVGNVAEWINQNTPDQLNELYVPDRRYDVVVFQKVMDARAQAEADKIRAYGGRVVFDANVNYYERWGDYFIPGTRPTDEQQRDAISMTTMADCVVADSSYLASVIEPLNPRVTWIPDNVDTTVYGGVRTHRAGGPLRLVWSGIGKKAAHLLEIRDVLGVLSNAELILVVDEAPECLSALAAVIPCQVVTFSDRRYARTLLQSDVIISPKRLVNAYELGHTEYKIALGMAVGLPAVASPQQSYVEAIGHRGGGIIAATAEDWLGAFARLRAPEVRADLGARARHTVLERYATPVVAEQYRALLQQLVRTHVDRPAVVQ